MINGIMSSTSHKIRVDSTTDRILIGDGAGKVLTNNDLKVIAIGSNALDGSGASTTASNNVAVGYNSLGANTSGDGNTAVGNYAGDALTTGIYNTIIGYAADGSSGAHYQTAIGYGVSCTQSAQTKIGYNGVFKFYSARFTCNLGGTDENDPCVSFASYFKLERYAVVKSVTVNVAQLSSDADYTVKIVATTDAAPTDNTVMANVVELLGAGESTTKNSAGSTADVICNDAGSSGILNQTYISEPRVDLSGNGPWYVYPVFANSTHTNDDDNPSTSAYLDICVEYAD